MPSSTTDADHDSHDLYRMGLVALIRQGESLGLLEKAEADSARHLSALRNVAVHQGVATEDQALEFADLAIPLQVLLGSALVRYPAITTGQCDPAALRRCRGLTRTAPRQWAQR